MSTQTSERRFISRLPRPPRLARATVFPLLWLCLMGCAYLGNPQAVLEEMAPNETLPPAWRISGGEGAELYVLGAIQMGPRSGWEYPIGMVGVFEESSALVVEVNIHESSPESVQELIRHYGRLPRGLTLERSLSPEVWQLLKVTLASTRIPLFDANRFRPWLLSNLIIMESLGQIDYFPEQGSAEEFIRRAGNRSIVPFETPAQQISFLGTLPKRVQELYLLETLKHYGDPKEGYVGRYVNAWRAGDERALEDLIFEDFGEGDRFAPFFETMIYDRSARLVKELKSLLDAVQHSGESVFVVLEVSHMIGDRGVAAALKDQGYRVDRVERSDLRRVAPGAGGADVAGP
ncbi:MAG: TraB/GumN family protein [Myxococcota bacterium]|nr:TraB/GumN family protein [Myxococcota bacterium]